jgi:hypothetical protein
VTLTVQPFDRQHQTAIVFDIRGGFAGPFEERAKRLKQSVNGSNIKADHFTLSDSGLSQGEPAAAAPVAKYDPYTGLVLKPGFPAALPTPATSTEHAHDEVRKALAGYNMVAIVTGNIS